MTLENKVALITGGSSGLGRAAAEKLADAGAKVAILGRTEERVVEAVQTMKQSYEHVMALVADVSIPLDLKQSIDEMVAQWGRLDIVFANAGINGKWASLEDLTPEDWDTTLNVNLKGTFLTVKYSVPYLKKNGGSIIVTSSVNGTRMFSNTGATAYACSKAAQVAFVKMTALELAKHRVRINVICPGAIESEIDDNTEKVDFDEVGEPVEYPKGKVPLTDGNPGKAEQVGDLVLFLASQQSSHITGSEIWIDGGQSLLQG